MKVYTLYVHDDRYSVPSLDAVSAREDERALELAEQRLASSPHYQRVEVWDDDRLIGKFGREDS